MTVRRHAPEVSRESESETAGRSPRRPRAAPTGLGNGGTRQRLEADAQRTGRAATGQTPQALRRDVEARYGVSIGALRVHADADADRRTKSRGAAALTVGDDIFVQPRLNTTATKAGRSLLAHEYAHVAQGRLLGRPLEAAADDDSTLVALDSAELRRELYDAFVGIDGYASATGIAEVVIAEAAVIARLTKQTDLRLYVEDHDKAVKAALETLVEQIDSIGAKLVLAGQADAEIVDYLHALRVLGMSLGSADLTMFDLPTSFGTWLFAETIASDVADYLGDTTFAMAEAAKAWDASSGKSFQSVLEDAVYASFDNIWHPELHARLKVHCANWADPFGLLELEMEGAVVKLYEAISGHATAKTIDERRLHGGNIGYLGRYLLLLNRHLGDLAHRVSLAQRPDVVVNFAKLLGDISSKVGLARSNADDEVRTLDVFSSSPKLLTDQNISIPRPTILMNDPLGTESMDVALLGDHLFPATTDELTTTSLERLATRLEAQKKHLEESEDTLAPKPPFGVDTFEDVYDRWFTFFSTAERDNDTLYKILNDIVARVFTPIGYAGAEAIGPRMFMLEMLGVGTSKGVGNVSVVDEVTRRANIQRSDEVRGPLYQGRKFAAKYRFAELASGQGSKSRVGEENSRKAAVGDATVESSASATALYSFMRAIGFGVTDFARELGLIVGNREPAIVDLWERPNTDKYNPRVDDDYRKWKSSWNFLLHTVVAGSGVQGTGGALLQHYYEHRVIPEDLATYLVALTQHERTSRVVHFTSSERTKIGTSSARRSGLENAEATNVSTYVEGSFHPSNARADDAKKRIEAARLLGARESRKGRAHKLRRKMEASMDGFFSSADVDDRLAAIFHIGVREHGLDRVVLDQFSISELLKAAKIAAGAAAAIYTLSRFGPGGRIAAQVVASVIRKVGINATVATLFALGHWVTRATSAQKFSRARAWAFAAKPVAFELGALAQGFALQRGIQLGLKLGSFRSGTNPPKNARELGKQITNALPKEGLQEVVLKLLGAQNRRIAAGRAPTADDLDALALLKTLAPDVYAALRHSHKKLVPHVTTDRPLALAKPDLDATQKDVEGQLPAEAKPLSRKAREALEAPGKKPAPDASKPEQIAFREIKIGGEVHHLRVVVKDGKHVIRLCSDPCAAVLARIDDAVKNQKADPAELAALKTRTNQLQKDLDAGVITKAQLDAELVNIEKALKQAKLTAFKIAAKARERQKKLDEGIARADKKKLDPADRTWLDADPRRKELAYDPATDSYKIEEAKAALRAEKAGILDRPVKRAVDESGREMGSDYIDGKGVEWDHKDFREGVAGVEAKVKQGERILVDLDGASAHEKAALRALEAKYPGMVKCVD
ncbi:MAG: DUF4157 domain-containing protein [Deltaproteobacteria bacterium]